jgi:hypothetical protein
MRIDSPHAEALARLLAAYPAFLESVERNALVWRDGAHDHRRRQVLEKHGFIWGGKWYHFDTMHLEHRPELLPPS